MPDPTLTGLVSTITIDDPPDDPDGALPRRGIVRPADLVAGLTGVALGFFSLFVHAFAEWQYLGPDVEGVSVLGWLAPAIAGALCLLVSIVPVVVRAIRRRPPEASA